MRQTQIKVSQRLNSSLHNVLGLDSEMPIAQRFILSMAVMAVDLLKSTAITSHTDNRIKDLETYSTFFVEHY